VIILRSKLPRHYEAISETYTPIFWRKKARPGKSPLLRRSPYTAELVRGKRMDIMRKASYGACDKLALKQLKARQTFLHRE
jgi:hypothetical protein